MLRKYTTWILAALTATACSTASYTSYNIDILRPAYYTLPQGIGRLLVVNAAPLTNTSDPLINGANNDQLAYLRKIPDMICTFTASGVNRAGYTETVIENRRWTPEALPSVADSLCRANNCDAIIALTHCNYATEFIPSEYGEMVCALLLAISSTQMRIVMPDGSGQDFEANNDTLEWSFCDVSTDALVTKLPRYNEVYFSIAETVGERYTQQIVPTWETVTRYMLSSEKRKMQDAVRWASRGNWDNARDLWVENFKIATGADRARTAYNIALYYEHESQIDEAAIWCSKALDIYNNKLGRSVKNENELAQKLFEDLVQRQADVKQLDKQLAQ